MKSAHIHFFEQTVSTNNDAKTLAESGAEHGTIVWAKEQSAGRGRLGKSWISGKGKGIYCSIILRPKVTVEDFPKITLVAGVAVAELLASELSYSTNKIGLKWPNDVLVNGKKIAGILAESSSLFSATCQKNAPPFIVLGIGVNVTHTLSDFPEELYPNVTSILLETGRDSKLFANFFEPFLLRLQKQILLYTARFEQGEFSLILKEWRTFDYLKGQKMECVNISGKVVQGISLGVDQNGILHIQDKHGNCHEILSGDVRLAGTTAPTSL